MQVNLINFFNNNNFLLLHFDNKHVNAFHDGLSIKNYGVFPL